MSVQSDRGASCNSKASEGEEWRNKPPHSVSSEATKAHTQNHAYSLYSYIQTLENNMQIGMFVVHLGCTGAVRKEKQGMLVMLLALRYLVQLVSKLTGGATMSWKI